MILRFDEAMKEIENNDIDAFKKIWDLAIESCATIAQHCIEDEIAAECRSLKNDNR